MMQFQHIGQWLIDGKSPHTGEPVLETRRRVEPDHLSYENDGGEIFAVAKYGRGFDDPPRIVYDVGKSYAIQLGRGQKAIGRTPPIVSIRRQDVRQMTLEEMQTWGSWELTGIRVEHSDRFDEVRAMGKLSWLYENAPRFLRDLLAEQIVMDMKPLKAVLEAHQALWEEHCNTVIGSERYLELDGELEKAATKVIQEAWQSVGGFPLRT